MGSQGSPTLKLQEEKGRLHALIKLEIRVLNLA